jgi:hypothetical protein
MAQTKNQLIVAGVVVLSALLLTGSCQLLDSGELLSDEGTVRHLEIEGGCWAIETGGERYEPLNLPTDLREDGLRIRFEAEVLPDVATFCQVGPAIEVREAERVG